MIISTQYYERVIGVWGLSNCEKSCASRHNRIAHESTTSQCHSKSLSRTLDTVNFSISFNFSR